MASAWTESGINWDDLSRASIRDVVRELYIAVSERDFWVRHFSSGGNYKLNELPAIDYDATQRYRTKDQVDYICGTVNTWLGGLSTINYNNGDYDYSATYRGCMLDLDSTSNYSYDDYVLNGFVSILPRKQEVLNLGWSTYDKSEGGSYENYIQADLSFLRSYDNNESFRFTYEMMEAVFKILTKMDYVRAYTFNRISRCVPSFTDPAQTCVRIVEGYE